MDPTSTPVRGSVWERDSLLLTDGFLSSNIMFTHFVLKGHNLYWYMCVKPEMLVTVIQVYGRRENKQLKVASKALCFQTHSWGSHYNWPSLSKGWPQNRSFLFSFTPLLSVTLSDRSSAHHTYIWLRSLCNSWCPQNVCMINLPQCRLYYNHTGKPPSTLRVCIVYVCMHV